MQDQHLHVQKRAATETVLEEERRPACTRREEEARLARRAQKFDRYEHVLELHDQGLAAEDIGSRIGLSGRTVRRWFAHGSFPEARQRRRRPSLIDPYERSVFQWWQAGNRKGFHLSRALRSQGYKGSSKAMYRYLERLRTPQRHAFGSSPPKRQRQKTVPVSPAPRENFSAHRAAWLFVRQPEELDETPQAELTLIRQASPSAETASCLAQAFMEMIRERTGHQLDAWLSEAEASQLPELKSFAKGIHQDKAAVLAG